MTADAGPALLARFVPVPPAHACYAVGAEAAGRLTALSPAELAALAGAGLPHAVDPDRGLLFDHTDLLNVAMLGGRGRQSIPELARRFLLRFALGPPPSWYAPRGWLVVVRPPDAAGDLRLAAADLGAPGVQAVPAPPAAPAVAPPGYRVAVRLTGADTAVRDPVAVAAYEEVLAALTSGEVRYQAVTETLRQRHRLAWALGMADCVVVSRLLAERLRAGGLAARARRGYLLGLLGSDHAWCELREDGAWKPLDPVFASLATGTPTAPGFGGSTEFVAACRGARFNRLLPCRVEEAAPLALLDGAPAPPDALAGVSARPVEA